MTRKAGPPSRSYPAEDRSRTAKKDRAQSDAVDRPRLLRLALQYSVIEMARLPDVPDADVIYRALASDPAFEREFGKANSVFRQARRTELADLLKRSRTTDLSRIFVALRKLRAPRATNSEQSISSYNLSLLSDDELSQLESILLRALPQSAETVQTKEGTDNDERQTTYP
jgi:hypothetical protein